MLNKRLPDHFMRQLLSAFIRRPKVDCPYKVVVRTSVSVSPAAYCADLEEAQRELNRVVENCLVAGYSVITMDERSAALLRYDRDIQGFLSLELGIEQSPSFIVMPSGTAYGLSIN